MERMVTVSPPDATAIHSDLLPPDMKKELKESGPDLSSAETAKSLKEQMDQVEAELIRNTLIQCDWNQSKAARQLKISEGKIRYKMNQFGIQRNSQN